MGYDDQVAGSGSSHRGGHGCTPYPNGRELPRRGQTLGVLLLAAPDKFRSTATALQVAAAVGRAAVRAGWEVQEVALSDGGEGFLDVYGGALGARERRTLVTGPLGAPVEARWGLAGRTAVIEMAEASGLTLAGGEVGNDPLRASTRGTGELIAAALTAGARTIVVGCGGSATTDGGEGALEALRPFSRLAGVEVRVACDVSTLFLDAAERFAPQKGATPAQVQFLARRLEALAERYRRELGSDVSRVTGGGAAGGLAGGLAAVGAKLVAGFELVAEAVGLAERVAAADLVVTGEGFFDAESLQGKVVGSVASLASSVGTPVAAVVGECFGEAPFPVVSLVELCGRSRALADPELCIEEAVSAHLAALAGPGSG